MLEFTAQLQERPTYLSWFTQYGGSQNMQIPCSSAFKLFLASTKPKPLLVDLVSLCFRPCNPEQETSNMTFAEFSAAANLLVQLSNNKLDSLPQSLSQKFLNSCRFFACSPEKSQQLTSVFQSLDVEKKGFLTRDCCFNFFLKSNAVKSDIERIWAIYQVEDKVQSLEFVLCMLDIADLIKKSEKPDPVPLFCEKLTLSSKVEVEKAIKEAEQKHLMNLREIYESEKSQVDALKNELNNLEKQRQDIIQETQNLSKLQLEHKAEADALRPKIAQLNAEIAELKKPLHDAKTLERKEFENKEFNVQTLQNIQDTRDRLALEKGLWD